MFATTLEVNAQLQCSAGNKCPESAPCCSEFGFCGIGRFCLGGCNPLLSHAPNSCAPNPICQTMTYDFKDTKKFIDSGSYNGETKYDFTTEGQPIFSNGIVLLTMAKNTPGTRLSTTRYTQYGRITARLKTSRTQGIVTAFITMSNIKDEIDWEWVGHKLDQGQSNYFYRGHIDYKNGDTHTLNSGDTFNTFHDYTIDWQENQIQWFIDGKLVRTLNKKDTFNETSGTYSYPSTPSRVQLSIWNGGEGAAGTKEWAGGQTNWDSPDVKLPGYFYVQVQSLDIKCYGPQVSDVPGQSQLTSFIYGASGNISVSNANTVVQVATPQSQGVAQDAGNNVNLMSNFTGQYIANLKASGSSRLVIATSIMMITVSISMLLSILEQL
ncbi:hypothetical protein G9A89_020757 [Geosiphon pyriformis]|nr:hypothetical protein G9A89_020757 [Geosiphon pyriformis]